MGCIRNFSGPVTGSYRAHDIVLGDNHRYLYNRPAWPVDNSASFREHPMAVETIIPLLEMGVPGDEILAIIDHALAKVTQRVVWVDEEGRPQYDETPER